MPRRTKETVMDDARLMVIRLDPLRQVERVGQPVLIRLVRLSYNMVQLSVMAELHGVDDHGKTRTLSYQDRKKFPDWVNDLVLKYMPDAFHDPAMLKQAERAKARERSLRRATPTNARPGIV